MEAHNGYIDSLMVAANVPVAATETTAVVLPGISAQGQTVIVLEGFAAFTTGATTTDIRARIRRGINNTGALVGQASIVQVGAALPTSIAIQVADIPAGDIANQPYCLTLQQTGGTANGAGLFASLQASWISQ